MEKIELLDLVFFGNESPIGNVGLIVNKSIIPDLQVEDDEFYIWQSGLGMDEGGDMNICGAQFRKFSTEQNLHKSRNIVLGKLKNNPLKDNPEKVKEVLQNLHKKYIKSSYEYSMTDCLGFIYPCIRKFTCHLFDAHDVLCSEFVANVLVELGILPVEIHVNEMIPVNFIDISTCTFHNKKYIKDDIIDKTYVLK